MSNELIQIETPFQFSEENQREFDKLIQRYPVKEAAMLPALHLAQKQAGYISPAVMEHVAELLELPVMKVKDVVTFYPMFFEEPVGKYVIRVCYTLPCALRDCKLVGAYQTKIRHRCCFRNRLGKRNHARWEIYLTEIRVPSILRCGTCRNG